MTVDEAIAVFAEAFAAGRSFTHPFVVERVGPLTLLRDAPRRSGDVRSSEVLIHGTDPREALLRIVAEVPERHALCVFVPPGQAVPSEYKTAGYRQSATEALMVRAGRRCDAHDRRIRRVQVQAEADLVAKANRSKQVLPVHLQVDDARFRLYAAWNGEQPVGWVRCIKAGTAGWVSNLQVMPAYRRKGLGTGLMAALLDDDHRLGVGPSVLLASATGAKVYPRLGYQTIAELKLMVQPRKG